ncbi:MAG TPA: IclR family transcriptional regulator [Opitutaceae bacterium]|nr:IclR family transcriptional regulator [Opitutaceae bacterium]
MRKSPQYPVPALEKGLDVLETLAAVSVPQSLAELAIRLKRSSSELFRMLNCLESRGYILRDQVSGRYSLTLKLYSLAHAHSVEEKLLRAARGPMQDLTERLRESCHLSVLDRGSLLVLAQQESPERVRVSIEVGGQFDPVETASGRLLMAQLGVGERAEVLRASPSGKRLSGKSLESWNAGLAEIRRRGFVSAEGETIEGVRDLAVLVGNPETGILAALAVTRLRRRGQRERDGALIAAMKMTASEITGTLGLAAAA